MDDSEAASFKALVHAIFKIVDREAKRRKSTPIQVCGALGVVGGAVVAANVQENGGVLDQMMFGSLGLGFSETLKAARERKQN